MALIFKNYFKNSFKPELRYVLKEFNHSIALIADKELLIKNIISKLKDISNTDTIHLYLFNENTSVFEYHNYENRKEVIHEAITPESLIVKWLEINNKCLFFEKCTYLSTDDDYKKLVLESAIVVLPLRAINKITGLVVICGLSKTATTISKRIDYITLMIDQAAMAYENAWLYEQRKDRIKMMYRAEQLSTIGHLAAGAAHEIRNPLTIIRSTIQFLKSEVESKEMVDNLLEEVDRINSIIQGLLNFAKPSELSLGHIKLDHLIEQCISLAKPTTKGNIDFRFNNKCQATVIKADSTQLKQVILNILLNSIEAVNESPKGIIEISLDQLRSRKEKPSHIILEVKDNGCGIPTDSLEQIFMPFYTTKPHGTGLGLSICYGVIQRHGGELEAKSIVSEGTTITIKLPIS